MKIQHQTKNVLILIESGWGVRHWGRLMTIASATILGIMLASPKPLIGMAVGLSLFFLVLGIIAAVFMNKRLCHRLDKGNDTLTIEYPVYSDMRIEKTVVALSDVAGVRTVSKLFFREGESPKISNRLTVLLTGFSYVLKNGKEIESGIYSSNHQEINTSVGVVCRFLGMAVVE